MCFLSLCIYLVCVNTITLMFCILVLLWQLSCGFIGIDGFVPWYAGSLLAINTLGYDLLLAWALSGADRLLDYRIKQQNLHTNATSSMPREPHRLYSLVGLGLRALVITSSALSALILRRHLMVWAVFAPKLAIEACLWTAFVLGGSLIRVVW